MTSQPSNGNSLQAETSLKSGRKSLLGAAFSFAARGVWGAARAYGRLAARKPLAALTLAFGLAAGTYAGGVNLVESTLGEISVSNGARNGTVEKFSEKGLVLVTFEGELAMNNFSAEGTSGHNNDNTFEFSVSDPAIVEKVQKANDEGSRVQLKYHERLFPMNWLFCTERRTKYEVYEVNVLPNQGTSIPKTPGM